MLNDCQNTNDLTRAEKTQNDLVSVGCHLAEPRMSVDEQGKGGGRVVLVKEDGILRHVLHVRCLGNVGKRGRIKPVKEGYPGKLFDRGH